MKQSAKSMSSPNRTDHFPPPLMSFLRAEAGSRSRSSRSRSSPIFVRKKNVTIETQEPSSPKVTCMGQVRTRRSSKTPAATPARCRWIRSVMSFNSRHCRTFRNRWVRKRWALLFPRKRESRRKPSNSESHVGDETEVSEKDEESEGGGATDRVFATSVSSPPKNALILTRCRSAPHRSSYSYRYRSSPIRSDGTGEELKTERDSGSGNKATSQRESENSGLFEKLENSIGEGDSNSVNSKESKAEEEEEEEEEKKVGRSSWPLILTRCKSEPSRVAEKLYGKFNFKEEERSGRGTATNDSCLPNNMQSND